MLLSGPSSLLLPQGHGRQQQQAKKRDMYVQPVSSSPVIMPSSTATSPLLAMVGVIQAGPSVLPPPSSLSPPLSTSSHPSPQPLSSPAWSILDGLLRQLVSRYALPESKRDVYLTLVRDLVDRWWRGRCTQARGTQAARCTLRAPPSKDRAPRC